MSIEEEYVDCPFCKRTDFDLIGLKAHYEKGYCQVYNDTLTEQEERELRKQKRTEVSE